MCVIREGQCRGYLESSVDEGLPAGWYSASSSAGAGWLVPLSNWNVTAADLRAVPSTRPNDAQFFHPKLECRSVHSQTRCCCGRPGENPAGFLQVDHGFSRFRASSNSVLGQSLPSIGFRGLENSSLHRQSSRWIRHRERANEYPPLALKQELTIGDGNSGIRLA